MERNVNVRRKGPASPRNERLEDEEVFDYPGLEDESNGSGPVPRDAHIALRTGSGLLWVLKLCQMGDCISLSQRRGKLLAQCGIPLVARAKGNKSANQVFPGDKATCS